MTKDTSKRGFHVGVYDLSSFLQDAATSGQASGQSVIKKLHPVPGQKRVLQFDLRECCDGLLRKKRLKKCFALLDEPGAPEMLATGASLVCHARSSPLI